MYILLHCRLIREHHLNERRDSTLNQRMGGAERNKLEVHAVPRHRVRLLHYSLHSRSFTADMC